MKKLVGARLLLLLAGLLAGVLTGCEKGTGPAEMKAKPGKARMLEAAKVDIPAPREIDDAGILARMQLRDPNQLVDRLASWLVQVMPTMTSETLRQQLAGGGMTLQDLKPGQSVSAFALTPSDPNQPIPTMAVLIPAAANSPLIQHLSSQRPDTQVTSAGQYTMLSGGTGQGAAALPSQKLATLADARPATDLQFYLNPPAVMAKYGAQLNAYAQALPGMLALIGGNQPGGAQLAQSLPIMNAGITALLDGLRQAKYLSLGADLGPQIFELSLIAKGQPGTTIEKIYNAPPVSAPDLSVYIDKDVQLRALQTIRDLKGALDIYLKYVEIAMAQGKPAEMAKLREDLKDAEKVGKVTTATGFRLSPEGKAVYQIVTACDNPDAYMGLLRTKVVGLINTGLVHDFYKNTLGIEMSAKEDPQTRKVAGAEVHRYMVTLTGGSALPPAEKARLEKMFGSLTVEMAQIGDYVVATTGEPIDALATRVSKGEAGETLKALQTWPAGGNLYVDFNVPALLKQTKESMPPEQAARIPDLSAGAPPVMVACYHTGGLGWYRLGIPKGLLSALNTSPGQGSGAPGAAAK